MAKASFTKHKGFPAVDIRWPDGLRTRMRVVSDQKGNELVLKAQLSFMDDTWPAFRSTINMPIEERHENPGSFQAMADEYYRSWVLSHNKSTSCKKTFLERFKKRFSSVPPQAFQLIYVDRYVDWRHRGGLSNASINRELATLRHMFTWAAKRGYLPSNPIAGLEKLHEQEWAGPKPTDEIIEKVFEKLDPLILPVFIVIRETGARRGEVLALEHWQVDRDSRVITFAKRTKNGKTTVAPFTQKALDAIDSVPHLPGCSYVFYNPETKTRWSDLRRPWLNARKEAGFPWLRVRDLRPAFGIVASELGAPMHYIQSALGHGSVAVAEKYYAKYDPKSAARQLLRLIEGGKKSEMGTKTGTSGD